MQWQSFPNKEIASLTGDTPEEWISLHTAMLRGGHAFSKW
jgi:hypothetical protein